MNAHDANHLLGDLKRPCYSLVFNAIESAVFGQEKKENGGIDLSYSIGARIRKNGSVQSVSWKGPAFNAGMMPGMKVTKVNSAAFSIDLLRRLVQAASPAPIRLTVLNEGDEAGKISIDDRDGLRFPHLKPR